MSSKPRSRQADDRDAEAAERERLERGLVAGLEGTFPASDPVAVIQPAPEGTVREAEEETAWLAPATE